MCTTLFNNRAAMFVDDRLMLLNVGSK